MAASVYAIDKFLEEQSSFSFQESPDHGEGKRIPLGKMTVSCYRRFCAFVQRLGYSVVPLFKGAHGMSIQVADPTDSAKNCDFFLSNDGVASIAADKKAQYPRVYKLLKQAGAFESAEKAQAVYAIDKFLEGESDTVDFGLKSV